MGLLHSLVRSNQLMFQHVTTHIKMMAEAEQQKKYGPYVYMSLDT